MKPQSLYNHTAKDIMQRDVLTITEADTLGEALRILTENHVGGLPVMDSKSRCVGLVSVTDILDYEQEHSEEVEEGNAEEARYYDSENERWEVLRLSSFALESFADVHVSEVMAPEPIAVRRDTPVAEIARTMHKSGVHRVVVLDDHQHLFGIVSASDFVRLVAGAQE